MAQTFEPKNVLAGKSLTEEQVNEIYVRLKELVNSWNGTEIYSIETTEDPGCYWISFGGEGDFDTLNIQGYIPVDMVNDILAEAKETITE
jgi:hypothetical protein